VTNSGGTDTTTHVVQANVVCPAPVSSFTVSPGTGRKNETDFAVNNHSTNMTTAGCNNIWSWNWGDGSGLSSVENPPTHQYKLRGDYTISLTSSNLGGSMTSTRSVTVTN
jgi:PKD repeat protein